MIPFVSVSRSLNKRAFILTLLILVLSPQLGMGNDDIYNAADDDNDNYMNNANQNNANYYNNNGYNANNYNNNQNNNNDDNNNNNGHDNNQNQNNYNATNEYQGKSNYYGQTDDWVANNVDVADDDLFHWDNNVGFDGVNIMPVSCINYNNGHMIKFEFFKSASSYQCHLSEIGTFVVSISHYMRAYFNYQALIKGEDFALPEDVGYLNCVQLKDTTEQGDTLYAKIGCMERETYTSTKLALHLYTDNQCSTVYSDGYPARRHATKGFETRNGLVSSEVSFQPPFYTCQSCGIAEISETFNKRAGTWYDDDYISQNGAGRDYDEDEEDNGDDYFVDDGYLSANDDVYRNRRLDELVLEKGADAMVRKEALPLNPMPAQENEFKEFENGFWEDIGIQRRSLYDNNYDIDDWNMCQRVYRYGMWCDEECRSLDAFRTDQWSTADMFLLSIMCVFMASMMLLVVAKRLKAARKRRSYGRDDLPLPGLPPAVMFSIYLVIMVVVGIMAGFKFVNETLVFAVVVCIMLFIYMLRLTLFESRRPVLLATAQHDLWDNPMDEKLYS